MATRYDIGSLRPPERLPDGRLRVDGYLTRTGVFEYRNADGSTRREYRPDGEVFRAESLRTFADVPVTDDHPRELVTADNARELSVGFVSGEPRRDGEHVAARLVVIDAATIAKVEGGKVELSCGYECDLDPTPGVAPNGERYDATQINIRGNHVALVDVARAGRTARLRMDAATMVAKPETYGVTMETIEGLTKALAEANEKLGAERARADKAEADLKAAAEAHTAALAEVTARADGAAKDLEAERKLRTDAAAGEADRVRARVALEAKAGRILGAETDLAPLSDRDIKVAVVKRVDGDDIAADAHDAYVDGMFVSACKRADAGDKALEDLRFAADASREDGGSKASKARQAMIDRNRNGWKADTGHDNDKE